jgi:hypothetical protein
MAQDSPMTRRGALLTLLALATLPGCDELRRSNVSWPPPAGLLPTDMDPGRAAVATLTQGMQGASAGIPNDPARVARMAALLEWLSVELMAQPRWAPVPRATREGIGLARDEMRGALGADPLADSPRMAAALAAAYRALTAGNRDAAAAALPSALFPRGGQAALGRLSDPGPLPQGEMATANLALEVRRLDDTNGWAVEFDTPVPPERGGRGSVPFSI